MTISHHNSKLIGGMSFGGSDECAPSVPCSFLLSFVIAYQKMPMGIVKYSDQL